MELSRTVIESSRTITNHPILSITTSFLIGKT
jgi:hypothetical protein